VDHAVNFARWQQAEVVRGARFAVAGSTCYNECFAVDYVSSGRDYDSLSLSGYRRSSCYAAAAAAGSLSSHHHDNVGAGGRSSVGMSQSCNVLLQHNVFCQRILHITLFVEVVIT